MMRQRSNSAFVPGVRWGEPAARSAENRRDRGVALIVTLLLLFLMSVLGLAAVLSSGSDLMINGYYGNYRASFYAADSGLNIARQAIETQLAAGVPPAYAQPPIASALVLASNVQTYIQNNFNPPPTPSQPPLPPWPPVCLTYLNCGEATSSWAQSFNITLVKISPAPGTPTVLASDAQGATSYQYIFDYNLTSVGAASGTEQASVSEYGSVILNISAQAQTAPTNISFAAFGAFINSFPACYGPLVYGTLTGPMYANGEWNFGASGNYTFTDTVMQTGPDFSYITPSGTCAQSTYPSYSNATTNTNIAPNFENGYSMGVAPLSLPQNDFNQRWAVLDGLGNGKEATPTPSYATMNSNLTNVQTGNAYPNPCTGSPDPCASLPAYTQGGPTGDNAAYPGNPLAPAPLASAAGVYLPYTCSGATCSLTGGTGGMYIEANIPGVTTTVTLSTTGSSGQVYTIVQTAPSSSSSSSSSSTHCVTTLRGRSCSTTTTTTSTTTTPTTYYTVTIDPVAGTTTVASYTSTTTTTSTATGGVTTSSSSSTVPGPTTNLSLSGVPENMLTSPPQPSTMVYVDGNVSITGPSSGFAIQNNSMVTLTASGNITQTGNLLYATEPVTTTQNQVVSGSNPPCCNGSPVDTLIPQYQNMNQVLGLFTAGGEFILSPAGGAGSNIETDASIAAISANPTTTSGMMATTIPVNNWTNVGGRIENSINPISVNSQNVYFDRRFTARPGFAPPWFPSTSMNMPNLSNGANTSTTITVDRIQWVANTGGQ